MRAPQRVAFLSSALATSVRALVVHTTTTTTRRGVPKQQQRNRRLVVRAQAAAPSSSSSSSSSEKTTETLTTRRQRCLSGVQPTGSLHLGNYLGALRQWVTEQEQYDSLFFIVDMHAITVAHDPKTLADDTLKAAATYIAAGIDPEKSPIFAQSHVSGHAELTWLLNCVTPMSWLEKMIQYKEKAKKQENAGVGLFDYPVLMAADILLYRAEVVPVGEDQRQHIELARDIARRFNDVYCKRSKFKKARLVEPKALVVGTGARIMSLQDGTSKMSKSDPNDAARINLDDSPDKIRAKIKKCKTDAGRGLEWGNPDRPECTNLLSIYQEVTGATRDAVANEVADLSWGDFKPRLADALIAHLEPIQQRYADIIADPAYLTDVLRDGEFHANGLAETTLDPLKAAVGFLPRKSP